MKRNVLYLVVFVLAAANTHADETLTVIGYNTQSGQATADGVDDAILDMDGGDIWGFSEVDDNPTWATKFEQAAESDEGADFKKMPGTTGGDDRLLIIYDSDRLEKLDDFELHLVKASHRVRSPLVAHFRLKTTGQEFLFMVNHLYRGSGFVGERDRARQAKMLNAWARGQSLPIIAVGDYNFDWHVERGDYEHARAFDELTNDGIFTWVRPKELVKTHDSDYNSVLDFVFVANAFRWDAESTILVRDEDFPDDETTSRHRPITSEFEIPD